MTSGKAPRSLSPWPRGQRMGLWPRTTAVEHREAGVGRAPSAGLGDQQSHRLESHSQFTPFTGRGRLLASAADREPPQCLCIVPPKREPRGQSPSRPGFLNRGTISIWGWIILFCGGLSSGWWGAACLSSIRLILSVPLSAVITKWISRHCPMSPGGQKGPH